MYTTQSEDCMVLSRFYEYSGRCGGDQCQSTCSLHQYVASRLKRLGGRLQHLINDKLFYVTSRVQEIQVT